MIFQNCCGLRRDNRYGLVSLTLVCRFWHAIVNACPALWTSISFQRSSKPPNTYGFKGLAIACKNRSNLEHALTRAGTTTLTLGFYLGGELNSNDEEEERVRRLFGRCRNLSIALETVDQFTLPGSIIVPHLENLMLRINENAHIEPLLDSIESSSPLLRSLFIRDCFPANLAQREHLLGRLVKLDMRTSLNGDISFFSALQNLEELV
jgi:hypothetical protein